MGEEWSVTNEDVDELLKGAIDAHVHGAPDPLIDVGWDMAEIAKYACDAEMSALVFKAHTIPTAATTLFVQNTVNEYAQQKEKKAPLIIGGVTLNSYVGGLNPKAVEMCIKLGGKVVWLPSHDAAHHNRVIGEPGGIELLTPDGKPLRSGILHMVKEAIWYLISAIQEQGKVFILEEAKRRSEGICLPTPIGMLIKLQPISRRKWPRWAPTCYSITIPAYPISIIQTATLGR